MTVELESEVQRMCNLGTAIESKARDEGLAEGRNEGVDLMAKLVDMLMEADRYADVIKATKAQEYREKLMKVYTLDGCFFR